MEAVEFDRVLDELQTDPDAGIARQREAHEAIIENLLHAGGREDRHHHIDENKFGLMRRGGGFGGVIVAHQRQHAAIARGAGEIDMAQRVAGAIDSRPLAVPDGEDAVIFAFAAHLRLLRAPYGGGGEVLVEARHEEYVALVEERLGAMQLRVHAAERRAAIAGDEARRAKAGATVHLLLHEQKPHDRLCAVEQHMSLGEIETVGEGDVAEGGAGFRGAGDFIRHSYLLLARREALARREPRSRRAARRHRLGEGRGPALHMKRSRSKAHARGASEGHIADLRVGGKTPVLLIRENPYSVRGRCGRVPPGLSLRRRA